MRRQSTPVYDGDGRREMRTVGQEILKDAVQMDRRNLGSGAVLRLRVAAAMRREHAAYLAEQRTLGGQTQPRSTTTTTTR